MSDDETNEGNAKGKEADTPKEEPDKSLSLYDKTEKIVSRQEEANKKTEELLKRQETLYANQRLAGTTGGNVVKQSEKRLTDEEYADKFMKGEADPLTDDGISID